MTAIEYLKRYEPDDLKRCGAGEFELKSHDSFKINEHTSLWHWKSRDIGGKTALDFLIKVREWNIVEAVFFLCGENPAYIPERKTEERKPLELPPKNKSFQTVRNYLLGRGISQEVIDYCYNRGILYESYPYHNAVFVGKDENGTARYAMSRGTYRTMEGKKPYRKDEEGSTKAYSFHIPPDKPSNRVAIYEAAIEAMSHMTLEDGQADKYRLSLGGIYAPKNEQDVQKWKQQGRQGNVMALDSFFQRHVEITEIEICLNNDFAGRFAAEQIRDRYGKDDQIKIIMNLPERDGEDYNDQLRRTKGVQVKKIMVPAMAR